MMRSQECAHLKEVVAASESAKLCGHLRSSRIYPCLVLHRLLRNNGARINSRHRQ